MIVGQGQHKLSPSHNYQTDQQRLCYDRDILLGPECYVNIKKFRQHCDEWAAANGQRYVLDRRRFDRALESKGFVKGLKNIDGVNNRSWIGVVWVGDDERLRQAILDANKLKPAVPVDFGPVDKPKSED